MENTNLGLSQKIGAFIYPDGSLNLKAIFDNLRNYMICGVAIGFAKWMDISGENPAYYVGIFSVCFLFFLNACQSYLIWMNITEVLNRIYNNIQLRFGTIVGLICYLPTFWVSLVFGTSYSLAVIIGFYRLLEKGSI